MHILPVIIGFAAIATALHSVSSGHSNVLMRRNDFIVFLRGLIPTVQGTPVQKTDANTVNAGSIFCLRSDVKCRGKLAQVRPHVCLVG